MFPGVDTGDSIHSNEIADMIFSPLSCALGSHGSGIRDRIQRMFLQLLVTINDLISQEYIVILARLGEKLWQSAEYPSRILIRKKYTSSSLFNIITPTSDSDCSYASLACFLDKSLSFSQHFGGPDVVVNCIAQNGNYRHDELLEIEIGRSQNLIERSLYRPICSLSAM